jgi:hypothetical protein
MTKDQANELICENEYLRANLEMAEMEFDLMRKDRDLYFRLYHELDEDEFGPEGTPFEGQIGFIFPTFPSTEAKV